MAGSIPYGPLISTLCVQVLCTMAVYSMPVLANVVAAEFRILPSTVGLYVSMVYGCGMVSAVLSPGFIYRYGATRISQYCLVTAMAGLAVAGLGSSVAFLALSALVIAAGYGATAPSSSHLIVRHTPPAASNIVFSIRQTGVPLGGAAAGLLVPPLLLTMSEWREVLLLQLVPCGIALLLLERLRPRYDADRDPRRPVFREGVMRPLRLVVADGNLLRLSIAGFVYSGVQLCFGAFIVAYLNGPIGIGLVGAGHALAAYQVAGVTSRVVLGWVADKAVPARLLLGGLGLAMAAASVLTALFSPAWPYAAILAVCAFAGATASGFTGLAYAEYSRLGGPGRTAEATGAGAFAMFFGSMTLPAIASGAIWLTGSYTLVFDAVAAVAAVSGVMLLLPAGRPPLAPTLERAA